MAYMKSLTVSGQTYQVKDPEAVTFAQAQPLTPAQQAQARENMGILSAKEIADMLCPSFTESGTVVTCEPVEGYPLEVTADSGATNITRTGKNVFGGDALTDVLESKDTGDSVNKNETNKTVTFNPAGMTRTSYLFNKFKENTRYTILFYGYNDTQGDVTNLQIRYTDGTQGYVQFNEGKPGGTGAKPNTPNWCRFVSDASKTIERIGIIWANGKTTLYYDQCGIFEGNVFVEEFEAYRAETFSLGEQIPALPGVNTLWADTGNITVKGKADLVAIIKRLTAAATASSVSG